jgi:anti-sigma factor RsiW
VTRYEEKLSAFLDGELPDAEAREIEKALESNPALQADLEQLMAADALARDAFAEMLAAPVPAKLASAVRDAPVGQAANATTAPAGRRWLVAASVALALALGGVAGFVTGANQATQVVSAPGWLADIADYHRVYAGQSRHLVEVAANEADHIETWLTATVGAEVRIPDLADQGLTFQGARLLVAAGKPVAQLMFTDAELRVVALCLIQSDAPQDGFATRQINNFDMVTWGAGNANFVVVGNVGRSDLSEIARSAATQV